MKYMALFNIPYIFFTLWGTAHDDSPVHNSKDPHLTYELSLGCLCFRDFQEVV